MLRNYLVTALRNLRRNKAYSFINIGGLALGLACSFFVVLWVQDEMSYDTFLEEGDQIFRVMRHSTFGGTKGTTASIPKPLRDLLDEEYPEITHTVLMSWENEMILRHENNVFRSTGRYFGKDFFTVFKLPLLAGDPATALINPESVAMSESFVKKYFGEDWLTRDDLLGTLFRLDDRVDVRLTAVYADLPANSSLQMDFVVPVDEYIRNNDWVEQWDSNGLRMFARLDAGADPAVVSAKIKGIVDEHVDSYQSELFLQPITDWYLRSDFENGVQVGGRIDYVRIFLLVAVFILLIAAINFMNLSTARSAQRAREIGVRKAVGATRSSLSGQFMGESLLTAALAFVAAMGLVAVLLPGFNAITGKSISLPFLNPTLLLQFAGLALATGLLAGSYPALYLSSFSVIAVLKGNTKGSARGGGLRKGLVVFQFVMSIMLIVGTLTVYQQLSYIRTKDLGVDRENLVYLKLEGGIEQQFEAFKKELMDTPGIVAVTRSSNNPLAMGNDTIGVQWDGKEEGDNTLYYHAATGYDFLDAMRIDLLEGRPFSRQFGADSSNYIVNEKAAAAMGMENPLGQRLAFWGVEGTIIGVMKDFHMSSMYRPISPVIFRLRPEQTGIVFVRIAAGHTTRALAGLGSLFKEFNPDMPLNYRFVDQEFGETYRSEVVIGTLASTFAILAVLIACLGLFGLASFTAEQRTKEIGVRKVLGASVSSVVLLLSREFVVLVVGAFAIAAPLSFWAMSGWLDDFTFHTEMGSGVLAGAGLASLAIAWITVGYQSYRAAALNPAVSLRAD